MVKITCGACEKLLSIDETKLPMKEVVFPCPLCKTRVELDRRRINENDPSTLRAAPARSVPSTPASEDSEQEGAGGEGSPSTIGGGQAGRKALIVGTATDELAAAAGNAGYNPVHVSDIDKAREWYLQEFPDLVLLNLGELGNPPSEDVAKFLSMSGVDRRRGFLVLVGDNLKTLDGNGAFLYQVNLTLATKDLGQFARIYDEARRDHDRLVAGFPGAQARVS